MSAGGSILIGDTPVAFSTKTTPVAYSYRGRRGVIERHAKPLVLSLLAEARIFADYSQTNSAGTVVKNQNAPEPGANLLPFPSGPIVNEVPSANVVLTNYSTGNATKIVTIGANRSFYMARPSLFTPAIANGTISVRWRMRSVAGKGSQTFDTLFPGSNTLGQTVTESWATYEQQLTYSGSGDLNIRFPADDTQVEIDELQFYEGALASMPAFSAEVHGGVRKALAHAASLTFDGNGAVDTASDTSGLIAIDPAFPAKHTYSEITVLEVRSVASGTSGGHLLNLYKQESGTSLALLRVDNDPNYVGEINSLRPAASRASVAANLRGKGVFISGWSSSATEASQIIEGARVYRVSAAFTPIATNRFLLGSYAGTEGADQRNNFAPGKHVFTVIWDRALTDEELAEVSAHLHRLATAAGHTMASAKGDHPEVWSGDSNCTRTNPTDHSVLTTHDGRFSPGKNMICANTSVGGQGIDAIERASSGTESGLPDGTVTANGRFGLRDGPCLLAWAKMGFVPIYFPLVGTNDWDLMNAASGTPAEQGAAIAARHIANAQRALDLHPNVRVRMASLLPQDPDNGREDWEAQRAGYSAAIGAWVASEPRASFFDVGGSVTIGDPANFATYYDAADYIHLIAAGDAEYDSLHGAQIEADRTAWAA